MALEAVLGEENTLGRQQWDIQTKGERSNTWIDIKSVTGSTVDAMADAIENSAVTSAHLRDRAGVVSVLPFLLSVTPVSNSRPSVCLSVRLVQGPSGASPAACHV